MLTTSIDHIAIAVPDRGAAMRRFHEEMNAGWVATGRRAGSTIDQLRFTGGDKLEILGPDHQHPAGERLVGFLGQFGSSIHHVTVNVADVSDAVARLAEAGVRCAGVSLADPRYQEAFVRLQDGGGVLVQISCKDVDDEGWARRYGHVPTPPGPDAPRFLGARISHPDPAAAGRQWSVLGATISSDGDDVLAMWGESELGLRFTPGELRHDVSLCFSGVPSMPGGDDVGPDVLSMTAL